MGLTILLTSFTAWVPEAKSVLPLLWFSGFHCLCSVCCVHTWKWGRNVPRQDFYSFKISWVLRAEWAMGCNAKGSAQAVVLSLMPSSSGKSTKRTGQPAERVFFLLLFFFVVVFYTKLFSNRIGSLSCFSVRMHKYLSWHKIDGHVWAFGEFNDA